MSDPVNSPLLSRQRISVEARGEMVRMTFGNVVIDFDYETGLQLSQWLRVKSKQAKHNAGDHSRQWRALAWLDGLKA